MSLSVFVIKHKGYTRNNLLDYTALIVSDLAHFSLTGDRLLFLVRKQNATDNLVTMAAPKPPPFTCLELSAVQTYTANTSSPSMTQSAA